MLLAKDFILIFISKVKRLVVFSSQISPSSLYLCVHIVCSHWIGQSLDWDMMYVGAGIWPEITLRVVRMDQAA